MPETTAAGLREGEHVTETGLTGTVKFYNDTQGWGRINADDGRDGVFVHHTGLNTPRRSRDGKTIELLQGERVSFDIAEGLRGPKCVNVVLLDSHH